MSNDPSYYAARGAQERRLAMASADTKIRRIHLDMAAKYEALAGTATADAKPVYSGPEQRTA